MYLFRREGAREKPASDIAEEREQTSLGQLDGSVSGLCRVRRAWKATSGDCGDSEPPSRKGELDKLRGRQARAAVVGFGVSCATLCVYGW